MKKLSFEDSIKQKLAGHQIPVKPELWATVAKNAGLSGSTGLGLGTWIGIASSVIIGTVVTSALLINSPSKEMRSSIVKTNTEPTVAPLQVNPIINKETQNYNTKATPIVSPEKNEIATIIESEPVLEIFEIKTDQKPVIEPISIVAPLITSISTPAPFSTIQATNPEIIEIIEENNFILPNTITPNNDGVNDFLSLNFGELKDLSLVIMDSKNEVIYRTSDLDFKWDGTLPNGDKADAGNYQYYFTARNSKGEWVTKYSSLMIHR